MGVKGVKKQKVLQVITGWQAVELILKCIFIGLWQLLKIATKRLWKGHRRKLVNNSSIELTVDSSIGTHYYIKIMGVKYHYVEIGPKSGQIVLVLGDAPDSSNLWCANWCKIIRELADTGYRVINLDLRGTGGSEGGRRRELSPPRAVEEVATLMEALGVSHSNPAIVIGVGVGGMLTWYLVHCHEALVSKMIVIGAPHPNLYWQYPPAPFCNKALYFIQWPYFPEQWLAEGELQESEGVRWSSSRACDWSGALNYVRGAAWWRIQDGRGVSAPALLVGARTSAAQLVGSAQYCSAATLRLVATPSPEDPAVHQLITDFLLCKDRSIDQEKEQERRGLVGRMLGAVAGRGRELTNTMSLQKLLQ